MADDGSIMEYSMTDYGSNTEGNLTYDYSSMEDDGSTEETITYYLWLIISPVLIVFGTVGNVLSITVMRRPTFRSSTVSVYLIALSLADISVLYIGLLRHFISKVVGIDVRHLSDLGCKIHVWLVYSSLDISVWILVAFTFERILSVYAPHKVKIYCTRMSSTLIITGIVVFMLALNSHTLNDSEYILAHNSTLTGEAECDYKSLPYRIFDQNIWPWLDFSVYNLIPFIILITGNSCIAVKVKQHKRKLRRIAAQWVTSNYNVTNKPTRSCNQGVDSSTIPRREKISSTTVVLLILNLVFLITTTPVSVFLIVQASWLKRIETSKESALWKLTYAIVNLIMYVNHSVNFILYCTTGSRFRKELNIMFSKQRM